MATFHQNLVQSFLNFKNKYMRQYDTYEDAVDDIDNIPEGGIFYTNDNASVQDIIDGMTALHFAGSQVGAGTKNFTFNTEAQKRMLCITKKSGVIVESKEIPVDVLSTGDVIPLGQTAPIIGTDNINSRETLWTDGVNKQLEFENDEYGGLNYGGYKTVETSPKNIKGADRYIGLAADISKTTGASLTYNGNNSFTITVTDSTLSVYVYVDMLVLGGSASGRNVSFDAAGTSLESTDVEGAIKEVNAELIEVNSYLTTEKVVGKWIDGITDVFEQSLVTNNVTIASSGFTVLDNIHTTANTKLINVDGAAEVLSNNVQVQVPINNTNGYVRLESTGLGIWNLGSYGTNFTNIIITLRYIKK